jgi:hypothetical protein
MVLAAAAAAMTMACSPTREEPSTAQLNTGSTPPLTSALTTTSAAVTPTGTAAVTPTGTTEPPTSQTAAGKQVISVSVTNGQVSPAPAPVDVKLGGSLIIEVMSDTNDEIHVHGYEITAPVTAGQPTRIPLAATIPGQFDVELHSSSQLLLILRVR